MKWWLLTWKGLDMLCTDPLLTVGWGGFSKRLKPVWPLVGSLTCGWIHGALECFFFFQYRKPTCVNILKNGHFCNVRNEIYTENKAILASVQVPTLTIIMRNLVSCRGANMWCSCPHLWWSTCYTHVPWSTSDDFSTLCSRSCMALTAQARRDCNLFWRQESPSGALACPPRFHFSQLFIEMQNLTLPKIYEKFFPKIIITQAMEKAQLKGTVLSLMFRTRIKGKINPSVIGAFL